MKLFKIHRNNIILLAALFALTLISCSSDDPIKNRNSAIKKLYTEGVVKIAAANSFSINTAQMWEGLELARDKIERENLCPAKIELQKIDDGGDPISGINKAHEIASQNGVSVVIGHAFSDITLPCSLIYQYYGILTMNFISTADNITARNNPILFSNVPNDEEFGRNLANVFVAKGFKNIIIYYMDNNPGVSMSNSLELYCNKQGINIVNRESFDMSIQSVEIDRTIKRWKNNFIFDAVFVTGRMPTIYDIITIMRNNEIECPIIGSDSFDDPVLASMLTLSENDKVYAISNYNPKCETKEFKEFFDNFVAKYGKEPDQEALQAYDALIVIAKAIAEADSALPEDIAQVLRGKMYSEAAGPYVFTETGAISGRKLTPKVFRDGEFVNLE